VKKHIVTAVIPARMGSSRYPGKPLAKILDVPMVEHVRRRTLLAAGVDHVVVATCDDEILKAVLAAGGRAVMTRDTHERCTDRVQEAMEHLPGDIVAIVQGDEPLLVPEAVQQVVAPLLADGNVQATNLLSPLESDADLDNPNIVKAVCGRSGDMMYLTRGRVPFMRVKVEVPIYRQTGIMAFRTAFLHQFSAWAPTPLEVAESVDMMRVLENGVPIRGVVTDYVTLGVDRPADIPLAERALREDVRQRALHEQVMSMGRAS
jgi:3-deoxy-manno-octulosonate cytidylyltransferase (CMP-KDO synthetase)